MKSKTIIIIMLFMLQCQLLFSQCISIELSVTWEMKTDILNKDSIVNTPILNIMYRNNCNGNYYFLKVSESKDSLPRIYCGICYFPSDEKPDCYKTMKYWAKRNTNQNFNIHIRGLPRYGSWWKVYPDTLDITKAHSPDVVECGLESLNECISCNNNLDSLKMRYDPKGRFEPSDVLPENILDSVSDQFVFLKSGEVFVDTYNLVAFKIIEGCYTFYIDQEDIKNYVIYSEMLFDENNYIINQGIKTGKYVEHNLELPDVVGEYQLYSGAFKTNKVTVCFGER